MLFAYIMGPCNEIITYKDIINLLESKVPSDVPLYIVGLPEDYSSAEIVKRKFDKIIRNLTKAYPEVEQAKASSKHPQMAEDHFWKQNVCSDCRRIKCQKDVIVIAIGTRVISKSHNELIRTYHTLYSDKKVSLKF
jgi:hypothetical protein